MNRALLLSSIIATLALPGQSLAGYTGLRTITNVGCHLNDTTCWVEIAGPAVGPEICRNNNLRFSTNSPNGKNILSLVTAAFLAGKQVNLNFPDTTCYADQSPFPTIYWLNFT